MIKRTTFWISNSIMIFICAALSWALFQSNRSRSIEELVQDGEEYGFKAGFCADKKGFADSELSYISLAKYMEALALDPERCDIKESIAGVYYRLGELELAEVFCSSALKSRTMSAMDRNGLIRFRHEIREELHSQSSAKPPAPVQSPTASP